MGKNLGILFKFYFCGAENSARSRKKKRRHVNGGPGEAVAQVGLGRHVPVDHLELGGGAEDVPFKEPASVAGRLPVCCCCCPASEAGRALSGSCPASHDKGLGVLTETCSSSLAVEGRPLGSPPPRSSGSPASTFICAEP